MHIHEQEEREYQMGAMDELQNAYAQSQHERKPDDSGKINELLAAGKFVIILEGTDYCPRTDAILGMRQVFVSAHDTKEAAQTAMPPSDGDCEEVYHRLLEPNDTRIQKEIADQWAFIKSVAGKPEPEHQYDGGPLPF